MMTSLKFVFYLTCLFLRKVTLAQETHQSSYHQESDFKSVNVGETVILPCFYGNDVTARLYWYKQTLGQKPKLISSFYIYDGKGFFYNEFVNNSRFTLDTENSKNHLSISDLRISDSATYYCANSDSAVFEFAEVITVSVKGSGLNINTLVQSSSETVQLGDSVTLNCTVHTGTCDGEHRVYWFKDSEESHPGLIYTHGGRNDQCERKSNTKTQNCFYNLPMDNLNLSHNGIYYCAVASCGYILFGNGTKLELKNEEVSLVLVYFLSGALAFTTILTLLLAASQYIHRRNSQQATDERFSASYTINSESFQAEENLHYAALRVKKANRSRSETDDTEDKCIYSGVRK
ncbi:immunoglobulin kappa light chain-like isoform X2 [Mugil cephalus]|uniref:immunoglobulin kappa light chain-like isoform X2 n=1 Tax=Mugil cephalus TaxID=48193 RepID=UPI001FB572E5|nr:immunoglobulin kappa light chain-like isoform X2 [Mugil cephalus]